MNFSDYITEILPKTINYRLARLGWVPPARPITLTFSVTFACNSRCKTCGIGEAFSRHPERAGDDLKLDEIERIFRSLGHVYFFNVSGGEPFLRKDLPQIIELACRYLKPQIIHIPTNALLPERIRTMSESILDIIHNHNPRIQFSVKPSIDGVGEGHDEIRGVPGNFAKLEQTIRLLKELDQRHANFHLELGTVVSRFNMDCLDEIENYVHGLNVQSYRNEIAEQREEFFNIGDPITPSAEEYERLMQRFKRQIRNNIKGKKKLTYITEALRLTYYDLAARIMKSRQQVIPCYAGISNVHLNYNGELWPCCVLGYARPLGNLRAVDYDFDRVWFSAQAREVRKYIKQKNCACPLANQAYSNILMNGRSLLRMMGNFLRMMKE